MANPLTEKRKRPLSPLQALTAGEPTPRFDLPTSSSPKRTVIENSMFTHTKSSTDTHSNLKFVSPHKICNWKYKDRSPVDRGDIDALAKSLKDNGQAQPCVVRPLSNNEKYEYELVIGERRHLAATSIGIDLLVMIENLSDTDAAIKQIIENQDRKDLSEYSIGMSYAQLIENNIITTKDLEERLNQTKLQINRLLSFSKVPKEIWDAIEDPSKISARTATELRALANKGQSYIDAIITLAKKISSGKMGGTNLPKQVELIVNGTTENTPSAVEIKSKNGRHLFTWRRDSNNQISISFPKDIRDVMDKARLEKSLKREMEIQLNDTASIHMDTQTEI
jgi:ParB family chromosome partitioning protein